MTETADRFMNVAAGFAKSVSAVSAAAWSNPSPCPGWTARDVVRHMVEWVPGFFATYAKLTLPEGPPVDDDPLGAWTTVQNAILEVLADPVAAAREFDCPAGRMSVEQSVALLVTGDVLIHTWDLARAAEIDESLDPHEVAYMLAASEPFDAMLRSSGQFGPRVMVPDNADVQTKLIAFMGRQP